MDNDELEKALKTLKSFSSLLDEKEKSSLDKTNVSKLLSKAITAKRPTATYNWAGPLRRNLDYQGIARRTFLVDDLPGKSIYLCG